MVFKNPYFFALLAVLIPYIVWYVLKNKKSVPALKMPETVKYRYIHKSFRLYLMHVPFILRIVLLTLVIIILARLSLPRPMRSARSLSWVALSSPLTYRILRLRIASRF